MKTPPFLLGVALLFWGWQTGYLLVGALLGVALESARFLKPRWDFADEDFSRIWTFCALLMLAGTVYAFTANDSASNLLSFLQDPNFFTQRRAGSSSAQSVASLLRWLPMMFFAFVAAGAYSSRAGVPLRTVSLILQRRWKEARRRGQPLPPSPTVDVAYPYFALCLFSASIQSHNDGSFFWGLCVLLAWALLPLRSRRYRWAAWAAALGLALTLGFYGQRAIADLHQYLGTFNPQWLTRGARRGFDSRQTETMLGQLGEAKLSPRIVIRLEALENSKPPALLREASYRSFRRGRIWSVDATPTEFETVGHVQTNDTVWVLLEDEKAAHAVANIACYLPGGTALLPLPRGTARLEELPAFILQKNKFGAVLAQGPGLVIFNAFFGPGGTLDSAPEAGDTNEVPSRETAALEQVIQELDLRGRTLGETTAALNRFFQEKFEYRTWQRAPPSLTNNVTPLARFLTQTRAGHCEYFATASVLLLRQLGFPARYAVGYAVHEKAGENRFVVRQRDAHAWCLVWNGSRWVDFDATPASWVAAEGQRASPFQGWSDFWSRLGFELSKVRWGQSHLRQYLLWALFPILGLLLFSVFSRTRRHKRAGAQDRASENLVWPGLDSEFYQLEKSLAAMGIVREPAETMGAFVARAAAHREVLGAGQPLHEAFQLHYRYRFDPNGLSRADRQRLRAASQLSLRRVRVAPARFAFWFRRR